MQQRREAQMGLEIGAPVGGMRPTRILQLRVTAQLIGHAQPFERADGHHSIAPVPVFGLAGRTPVT